MNLHGMKTAVIQNLVLDSLTAGPIAVDLLPRIVPAGNRAAPFHTVPLVVIAR